LLYLLDANVLIDANRDYYPLSRVPEYWEWLAHQGAQNRVKIPLEVFEEIRAGNDALSDWCKRADIKSALLLDEAVDEATVRMVVERGYAPDLSDVEIEKIGQDPFLIAYALPATRARDRCVVTTEVSRPRSTRANRKVPDVCNGLGALCCDAFEFVRRLDFSTAWTQS
jgi:hypothetical protein